MLVARSCPTLCNPMDCNPPGSSIYGILKEKDQSGLPFPSPRDLPNPGIEPRSPAFWADSLPSEPRGKPRSRGDFPKCAPFQPPGWQPGAWRTPLISLVHTDPSCRFSCCPHDGERAGVAVGATIQLPVPEAGTKDRS